MVIYPPRLSESPYIYVHMEQTAIQPIINGSFNPRLTLEDFKELPIDVKKSYIWNVMVSMEFSSSLKGVDSRVFQKPDKQYKFPEDKTSEELDLLFTEVRGEYEAHHNKMLAKTSDLHFSLGEKIYQAQRELGFGGPIEMNSCRVKGFIYAGGSWNDFDPSSVGGAMTKAEKLLPRRNYGPNNPNTGIPMHSWKVTPNCDYIILYYDFVDKNHLDAIEEFYPTWESLGRGAKADSIRKEVTQEGEFYSVELIWWWD